MTGYSQRHVGLEAAAVVPTAREDGSGHKEDAATAAELPSRSLRRAAARLTAVVCLAGATATMAGVFEASSPLSDADGGRGVPSRSFESFAGGSRGDAARAARQGEARNPPIALIRGEAGRALHGEAGALVSERGSMIRLYAKQDSASGQSAPVTTVMAAPHAAAASSDRSADRALQTSNNSVRLAAEPRISSEGGGKGIVPHVGGSGAVAFPALEESTVLFLHVFKCAGSTMRRMLVNWAEADGERGAVVHECNYIKEGEICLHHYELVDEAVEAEQIAGLKVLAGHFVWGFQRHVRRPYLMMTALRNPLEVFVSGQQYLNRKQTNTLEKSRDYVASAMNKLLRKLEPQAQTSLGAGEGSDPGPPQVGGFIRRFVGADRNVLSGGELAAATGEALRNLGTFWIVGVVEQYAGFVEVIRRCLDPGEKHREFWIEFASKRYNKSPIGSRDVLAGIDPGLVLRFNESLALQWQLYGRAVSIWDVRCREVLPAVMHEQLCTVPPPLETYV